MWGGPPGGGIARPVPAVGIALAPRGKISLPKSLVSHVPEIGVRAYRKPKPKKPVKKPPTPPAPPSPPVEAPDPTVR